MVRKINIKLGGIETLPCSLKDVVIPFKVKNNLKTHIRHIIQGVPERGSLKVVLDVTLTIHEASYYLAYRSQQSLLKSYLS